MSISTRFYLMLPSGVQKISQRQMNGLCQGSDSMPQFAGSKQKLVDVVLEVENGEPSRIVRVEGTFLVFDKEGFVHQNLRESSVQAMDTYERLERSKRIGRGKVVDLSPKLKRDKWERENRWHPSNAELEVISSDIFGQKKAGLEKVRRAASNNPKPPPMTYEATEALDKIRRQVFDISFHLEWLSEPALKALAFKARELSGEDGGKVWAGIADEVDIRREIKARHRRGDGTWFAILDVIATEPNGKVCSTVFTKEEKCNSKKEAEEAARKLLAEHAKYFSGEHDVQVCIICDLEHDRK